MMKQVNRLFLAVVLALSALPAFAAGMSDYLENKVIDHLFRSTAFTAPTTLCVGLVTGTSSDASTGAAPGTEASYTGYARTALAAGVANWKSTNGATSGASSGTGGTNSNAAIITIGSAATVPQSFNTHENHAPYFMCANRDGWTELYAQNHPAYGFYQDNGAGGNAYDAGLPKVFV